MRAFQLKNNVVHCYKNEEQGTEKQMIQSILKMRPNINCGNVRNIMKHYFFIILCFICLTHIFVFGLLNVLVMRFVHHYI